MSVPRPESMLHCSGHLTRRTLPGAQTQERHLLTIVEGEAGVDRLHDDDQCTLVTCALLWSRDGEI